jgi:hypothetical protein
MRWSSFAMLNEVDVPTMQRYILRQRAAEEETE